MTSDAAAAEVAPSPSVTAPQELARALTLRDSIALVLTVIGTGVFLKAAPMAQLVGSPSKVLFAWLAAGLLSLAGALTYAVRLAQRLEQAGAAGPIAGRARLTAPGEAAGIDLIVFDKAPAKAVP